MEWLKINNSLIDDPVVQKLPLKMFKAYVNTLCIANRNDPQGTLPILDKYAFQMRVSKIEAQKILDSLEITMLIFKTNSVYSIKDWERYRGTYDTNRLPIDEWMEVRRRVFSRDNHTCQYCGATDVDLHCDHIIPICRDGSNDTDNLATACKSCNLSKGGKLLEEWRP